MTKATSRSAKGAATPSTWPEVQVVDPADGVSKVLVVTAHPDDVDFAAAGTVACMTSAGVDVVYCVVTDGDAGGSDLSTTTEERAEIRREEQLAAAAKVGVWSVIFLGYRDGQVEASLGLRKDLARVIRKVRPDRVITQSPEINLDRIYASHPDHLAVGRAAMAAVYPDARNPFAFPELLEVDLLEPHTVPEVWVMAMSQPNVVVDTTDVISAKVEALMAHRSQVGDGDHVPGLITDWGRSVAKSAGLKKKRTAESFRKVETL